MFGKFDVFKVQLGVSAFVLVLSTGMLIAGRDAAAYLPIITSIVGYWLPAPSRQPQQQSVQSEASINQPSSSFAEGRSQRRVPAAVYSDSVHSGDGAPMGEISMASDWLPPPSTAAPSTSPEQPRHGLLCADP
jgi:hypothetical protein